MSFSKEALQTFKEKLKAGEVVAAPAEGVYGYCADPFNPNALEKLLAIKKRTAGKGFITLVRSFDDLAQLAAPLNEQEKATLQQHWPGQVTFILPAKKGLPDLLTGGRETIAVRMPATAYMHEYLNAWGGPLVSTSANISGQPPATDPTDLFDGVYALKSRTPLKGGVSQVIDLKTGAQLR